MSSLDSLVGWLVTWQLTPPTRQVEADTMKKHLILTCWCWNHMTPDTSWSHDRHPYAHWLIIGSHDAQHGQQWWNLIEESLYVMKKEKWPTCEIKTEMTWLSWLKNWLKVDWPSIDNIQVRYFHCFEGNNIFRCDRFTIVNREPIVMHQGCEHCGFQIRIKTKTFLTFHITGYALIKETYLINSRILEDLSSVKFGYYFNFHKHIPFLLF